MLTLWAFGIQYDATFRKFKAELDSISSYTVKPGV